jgi:hypothetical protein
LEEAITVSLFAEHVAEQLPGFSVETRHLQLADRRHLLGRSG